jgi:mono/diheme cytochrome c family protein
LATGVLLLAALLWVFWAADALHERLDANDRAVPDPSVGMAQRVTSAATNATSLAAEGEYLARIGNCAVCHTARGGAAFAGGPAIDTPFGAVMSTNITPDPTHGLGQWSADDFWRAMHHGKSRDGRRLSPAFPYTSYTRVSRADSDAMFAYLQTVTPVAQTNAPSTLAWPFNTQAALAVWRALYFWPSNAKSTATAVAAPGAELSISTDAALLRGAYLVQGLGHCSECHGARGPLGGLQSGKTLAGAVLPGAPWYAPSLQRADEAGAISVPQTIAVLQGDTAHQSFASGPMAEVVLHGTQYLRDADAVAIATYLQSVAQPAKATAPVEVQQSPSDPRAAKIYEDQCANCHGKDGLGQLGAYSALAANRAVLMDKPNNAVLSVLYGGFAPATAHNPSPFGMPPYLLTLSDAEVAAVLTHVRSSWGNRASAVSELQVQQISRLQAAH